MVDLNAPALLGHASGLTQKKTWPRFKLSEAENELLLLVSALAALASRLITWLLDPVVQAASRVASGSPVRLPPVPRMAAALPALPRQLSRLQA